uniref:Putative secreted protein n=1 Tax=Anopheles marajoara TaxID=58244 RepID=A0A2M4CAK9_9DIPT
MSCPWHRCMSVALSYLFPATLHSNGEGRVHRRQGTGLYAGSSHHISLGPSSTSIIMRIIRCTPGCQLTNRCPSLATQTHTHTHRF